MRRAKIESHKSDSHKSDSHFVVAMSAIRSLGGVLMVGAVLMAGCAGPETGSETVVTVFEGARLIVGDGHRAGPAEPRLRRLGSAGE